MKINYFALALLLSATGANADSSTLDAAIGGGVGGALGAAIGNEIGGRDAAIIGGALDGAVGTAVTTDKKSQHTAYRGELRYDNHTHGGHPVSRFCPPGQAKKGRC